MKTRWIGAFRNDLTTFLPKEMSTTTKTMSWAEQYSVYDAYAINNGLYEFLQNALSVYEFGDEAIRGLRNPIPAVLSFYEAKLWAGRNENVFKLETKAGTVSEKLQKAIDKIFIDSNWQARKQEVANTFPRYGDMFLMVNTKKRVTQSIGIGGNQAQNVSFPSVYIEPLTPKAVTKLKIDNRGFITYIRTDVPNTEEDENGREKVFTITEEWDKETQLYRRWKHDKASSEPINRLTGLQETLNFTQAWGSDFIPIVWAGFRLTGGERGESVIAPAIDKIDEANRMASALHRNIFRYNKPKTVVGRDGSDASGRPLPPVQLGTSGGLSASTNPDEDDIWLLPGATTVSSLVPNLNYADHSLIIDKQMDDIICQLPEIVYSMIQNRVSSNTSSLAISKLLLPASAKLLQARQNAEDALIRALQMAISIGQYTKTFDNVGDYYKHELDFTFAERAVWDKDEEEIARTMQTYNNAGVPVEIAAKWAGQSESEQEELKMALVEEKKQQEALQNDMLSKIRTNAGVNGKPQLNGVKK